MIKDNVFIAMQLLIGAAKEVQKTFIDNKSNHVSIKAFLKNFCTIKVCSARRSGHSTAIIKSAVDFERPLILFPNDDMAKNLKKVAKNLYPKESKKMTFCSINSKIGYNQINADVVFVDCTSLLSSTKIDELYSCFETNVNKFPFYIIFVE